MQQTLSYQLLQQLYLFQNPATLPYSQHEKPSPFAMKRKKTSRNRKHTRALISPAGVCNGVHGGFLLAQVPH